MERKDKSVREYGNYTIVKTQDGDISIVHKERGFISKETKIKNEINEHLRKVILPQVDKIIQEGTNDIYDKLI